MTRQQRIWEEIKGDSDANKRDFFSCVYALAALGFIFLVPLLAYALGL